MLAAMAHYIWANNLHDQKFMDKFVQGLEASTMPDWAKDKENFKDYIFGKYDGQPKTPEWAEPICGVKPPTSRSSRRCTRRRSRRH